MKAATKVLAWPAVLVVAALLFVYSGFYDVAADEPHWRFTERVLQTLRERSIETRAGDIVPPKLDDPRKVAAGARNYAEMCAMCHLAPGLQDTALRQGLYPRPPRLADHEMDARAAFWIIKHGIKASGMPAWGDSHDDTEIWGLVAFLAQLPTMAPERYRQLTGEARAGHGHP